jgi:hypothetical protein
LAADVTEEKIDALTADHIINQFHFGMVDAFGVKIVAQNWGLFVFKMLVNDTE